MRLAQNQCLWNNYEQLRSGLATSPPWKALARGGDGGDFRQHAAKTKGVPTYILHVTVLDSSWLAVSLSLSLSIAVSKSSAGG